MTFTIGRRELMLALAGAATSPFALRAQQLALPIIGFLESGSPEAFVGRLAKFRAGLAERGYTEDGNVKIEYRWAEGHYDRLPMFVSDLVSRGVKVIAATGSPNTAMAAQAATNIIPIVFANGGDPVRLGLVRSLSRPTGNATGVSFFNSALVAKRLQIVRELFPTARLLGLIVNPNNPNTVTDIADAQGAAAALGMQIVVAPAGAETDFDSAFVGLIGERASAIVINNDAFFSTQNDRFLKLSTRYRIPTIHYLRSFVAAGGLFSYGTDIEDMYREAGTYVARILAGAKPTELPVMLPTKFQFAVNLKTAKALGLEIPATLLVRANEVIE
jgi:putative ABC transport system substrate-binding protein